MKLKELYSLLGPGMRLYVSSASQESLTVQFVDVSFYLMYDARNAEAEVVELVRAERDVVYALVRDLK